MFPKQRCSVCQNRAWEGTSSGGLILENVVLKEKLAVVEKGNADLHEQIHSMQITIDNFKEERKDLLQEIKDLTEELKEVKYAYDGS